MNNAGDIAEIVAQEMGIDAAEVTQRKEFLELGAPDVALLQNIHVQISEARQGFAEGFYEYLRGIDELKGLLRDDETVAHLKRAHDLYFSQLTEGEYNWGYVKNRLKVGMVHSHIGLEPKWYVGAYRKYLSDMLRAVWDITNGGREQFIATFDALLKIVVFDICLTLDTYIHADQKEILRLKEGAENSAVSAKTAEQRYHDLVQGINAIVWEMDPVSRRFTYVNQRAENILGYPVEDWLATQNFLEKIIHTEDRDTALRYCCQKAGSDKYFDGQVEFRVRAKDGQEVWLQVKAEGIPATNRQPSLIRGLMLDISGHKRAEELKHLASHDMLTGLPNRSLFHGRLSQALAHARREGKLAAVFFMDLDRFKLINDSLGHGAGDAVLNEVAKRLTRSIRDSDTVARLGGDEFAMVVGPLVAPEDAAIVAQKILASLDEPALIDGHEIHLSGSIGISLYPQDGMDDETLIKHADAAMYYAKESGRSIFRFYSTEMKASTLPHYLAMGIENPQVTQQGDHTYSHSDPTY